MCEESACLVPPLETSQNGPAETRSSSGSGRGGSYNGEALVGFHEDALSQAAVGKAQLLLALVLGMGMAADCAELTTLAYILPTAEVHLCIDEQRKHWLVSLTMLALAGGSFAWGILGDHLGRRRALISALSVSTLFSAVAAMMPTYGTFTTAKFCSALGVGGAFPLSFSYLSETCSRATRTRYTGLLHSFWPLGAMFVSVIAHLVLPTNGADIIQDNREHWTSWHRFLLLTILPNVAAILGLLWASESPRYLLEASREVEALEVYQRLHRLNKARTQYGLTELELPGRSAYRDRPTSPSRNVISNSFGTFHEAIQRISSPTHFRTTLLLATLHLFLGFIYMGVSTISTGKLKELKDQEYYEATQHKSYQNFTLKHFGKDLENIVYKHSVFKYSGFVNVTLDHVRFIDCLIEDSEFIGVKTSVTYFLNSTIKNCKFFHTDLTDHHFINCTMNNNTFISLISECMSDFDYNIYLDDLYHDTIAWAGSMFPALIFMGFILETVPRPPVVTMLLALASVASVGVFFLNTIFIVTTVELIIKILLMCALNAITMVVVEAYPCHLRCTAHGLMRSLFHLASLCAINIYSFLLHAILLLPALVTLISSLFAALLSTRIQDNNQAQFKISCYECNTSEWQHSLHGITCHLIVSYCRLLPDPEQPAER